MATAAEIWNAAKQAATVYCRGVLGTGDIDDIAMEAALYALEHLGDYDSTKASVKTWMARIVKSKAASAARRRTAERVTYVGDIHTWAAEANEDDD